MSRQQILIPLFHFLVSSFFQILLTHVSHFYPSRDGTFRMSRTIAVVIQEDPRMTHRPVEALRIALGLVAGTHATTVVLLGEANRLLHDDVDDIVDSDILEKYLPSVQHLELPFVLQMETDTSSISTDFSVTYKSDGEIRSMLQSMDRTIVF